MDKVSVIIPVYNRHDTIHEAINSIYEQEWDRDRIEVIISDDCSTAPFDYLKKDYPGIIIIRGKSNRGAGVARQRGLNIATGDWIVFLDADDVLCPEAFKVIDRRYSMIINNTITYKNGIRIGSGNLSKLANHGSIYKKSALDKYKIEFDSYLRIYEDANFQLKCFAKIPDYLIHYTQIDGYIMRTNATSTLAELGIEWFRESLFEYMYHIIEYLKECDHNLSRRDIQMTLIESIDRMIILTKYAFDPNCFFILFDYIKNKFGIPDIEWLLEFLGKNDSGYRVLFEKMYDKYIHREENQFRLSIIIPLYNSHIYIREVITNLYENIGTYIDQVEVILEDDNSDRPDYSYLNHFKNIKIFYNDKNVRQGMNRNRGIEEANGKWIVFMDHDDKGLTKEAFDDFFSMDQSIDKKYNMIIGKAYVNNPHTMEFIHARYIELCHGVFFKKSFLDKYQIRFTEIIDKSEDYYFKQRCIYSLINSNKENTILIKDNTYYVWSYNKNSQFNTKYYNRMFEEEFLRENILCTIIALIDGRIRRRYWKSALFHSVIESSLQMEKCSTISKNYKKENAKYIIFLLMILNEYFDIHNMDDFKTEFNDIRTLRSHISDTYSGGCSQIIPNEGFISNLYNLYFIMSESHLQEIINEIKDIGIDFYKICDDIT